MVITEGLKAEGLRLIFCRITVKNSDAAHSEFLGTRRLGSFFVRGGICSRLLVETLGGRAYVALAMIDLRQ